MLGIVEQRLPRKSMYALTSVDWAAIKKVLTRELTSALRVKGGVPKRLLQHFVNATTKWLAKGKRAEALPLFSHEALRDTIIGRDREKIAEERSAKKLTARQERAEGTITTALTEIAKRLREVPRARLSDSGAETILVSLEISVGEERLQIELSGPLQKHRVGLGFPDDPGVGFLARILVGEAPRLSGASSPASATSRSNTPPAMPERSFLSTDDSNVLSQLLDLPSKIADQLSLTQPLRTPWETPPPPRDFCGRNDELSELLEAHRVRDFSILGVQGPSGIGKTALGLAVVERLRSRYQSTVFLDLTGNLEQPLSPSDVMRHVIHAYQPGRSLPDDTESLRGLYQSTLHDRNAILFFDNAADAAQIQPLVPPTDSLLLITSLRRFAFPGMHAIQLSPLEAKAAREFLIALALRCAPRADDLARLCGYFPIALRAAGHALAEYPNITVENYLERLRETQTRLALVDPTTDRSVEAVLDVGYALLPTNLQPCFDALAIFPATFNRATAGAIWRLRPDETEHSLGALLRMSFVEYDPNTDRYHLHDLLRLFANAQLRPSVRERLDRRFARHMRTVVHSEPWISRETSVTPHAARTLAMEWPNIRQVYRWATARPEDDPFAARFLATFQWPRAHVSPMDRANVLLWMANGTRTSNSPLQRRFAAVNITRKALYHANSREFLAAVHELGRLPLYIGTLGDLPALELLLVTLQSIAIGASETREIILSFLMPCTRSRASSLVQAQLLAAVGAIQGELGNHAEAVQYFDRATAMARDIDPQGQLAISLPAYACIEALANNDVDLAAAHADDLLRVAGADHRRLTTVLLGRLAPMLAVKGDIARSDRAYDLYVARSRDSTFIPESSRTLTNTAKAWYAPVLLGLAAGVQAQRCETRAIELLLEAQRVALERSDSEDENYANLPLGLLYAARKSFARARALLPPTLYREITRHGGRGLQESLTTVFSEFQP
jgi:hypothetical protein